MSTATNPWVTKVSAGTTGDFETCPAEMHIGQLVGMFDVGHHDVERTDDKTKAKKMVETRQVVLVYELAERQKDGRPFALGEMHTFSLNEKANLHKRIVAITGLPLLPGSEFDASSVLGKPVQVDVVHKPSKDGQKHYANINNVSRLPRGMKPPVFDYEPVLWSMAEKQPLPAEPWVAEVRIFGKTIESVVSESREFMGLPVGNATKANPPARPSAHPQADAAVITPRQTFPLTPEVKALAAKYGLPDDYMASEIPDQVSEADFVILQEFACPF